MSNCTDIIKLTLLGFILCLPLRESGIHPSFYFSSASEIFKIVLHCWILNSLLYEILHIFVTAHSTSHKPLNITLINIFKIFLCIFDVIV